MPLDVGSSRNVTRPLCAQFGERLIRDLRRLIKRIKWNCQCNQYELGEKVQSLACEIHNDWDAVIAFVNDPALPVTNDDAERALRCTVIARRVSFGTRLCENVQAQDCLE